MPAHFKIGKVKELITYYEVRVRVYDVVEMIISELEKRDVHMAKMGATKPELWTRMDMVNMVRNKCMEMSIKKPWAPHSIKTVLKRFHTRIIVIPGRNGLYYYTTAAFYNTVTEIRETRELHIHKTKKNDGPIADAMIDALNAKLEKTSIELDKANTAIDVLAKRLSFHKRQNEQFLETDQIRRENVAKLIDSLQTILSQMPLILNSIGMWNNVDVSKPVSCKTVPFNK